MERDGQNDEQDGDDHIDYIQLGEHVQAVDVDSLAVVDEIQLIKDCGKCVCIMPGVGSVGAFVSPPDGGGESMARIRYGSGRVRCVTRRGYLAPVTVVGHRSCVSFVQVLLGDSPHVKLVRYIYDPGGCRQSMAQGLYT